MVVTRCDPVIILPRLVSRAHDTLPDFPRSTGHVTRKEQVMDFESKSCPAPLEKSGSPLVQGPITGLLRNAPYVVLEKKARPRVGDGEHLLSKCPLLKCRLTGKRSISCTFTHWRVVTVRITYIERIIFLKMYVGRSYCIRVAITPPPPPTLTTPSLAPCFPPLSPIV